MNLIILYKQTRYIKKYLNRMCRTIFYLSAFRFPLDVLRVPWQCFSYIFFWVEVGFLLGGALLAPFPFTGGAGKCFQGSVQGFRVLFSHDVKNVDHLFELWGLPISNVTEIRIRDVKTV